MRRHTALFGLSAFTLVMAIRTLDVTRLAAGVGAVPRRTLSAFLIAVAVMLSVLWLGQLLPYYATGVSGFPVDEASARDEIMSPASAGA